MIEIVSYTYIYMCVCIYFLIGFYDLNNIMSKKKKRT